MIFVRFFLVTAIALATCAVHAQPPDLKGTPRVVQDLAAQLKGKSFNDVTGIITRRLGKPRLVGSGMVRNEWDVPGGVVSAVNGDAPWFIETETKRGVCLMDVKTSNPAGENIPGQYGMEALPGASKSGGTLWRGFLEITPTLVYQFKDRNRFASQHYAEFEVNPKENFFARNPNGTVEVKYLASFSAGTRLETIGDGVPVAGIVFVASEGGERAGFAFTKQGIGGGIATLEFKSASPVAFTLLRPWNDNGRPPPYSPKK